MAMSSILSQPQLKTSPSVSSTNLPFLTLTDAFPSILMQMPMMFDPPSQPQTVPTSMSSTDNNIGSHGSNQTQPHPPHLLAQSLQQFSGPGPLPRTANSSAPQTPMMEIEPSNATVAPAQSPQGAPLQDRQLNVTDALSYLDAVKSRFHDRTDVYNRFLDIMKYFKTQVLVSDFSTFFADPLVAYVFN
jgi:hypothetical protein